MKANNEINDTMLADYNAGANYRDLKLKYGKIATRIYQILRRRNQPPKGCLGRPKGTSFILTEEQKTEITEYRAEGLSCAAIAAKLKAPAYVVYVFCHGKELRKRSTRAVVETVDEADHAYTLHKQGLSIREISDKLQYGEGTIKRTLKWREKHALKKQKQVERTHKIQAMRDSGMTLQDIGAQMKLSKQRVGTILKG
jgi:Mor family transcriptional regulator